jgi:hypothetical protein
MPRQPARAVPTENVTGLHREIVLGCTPNDESNQQLPRAYLNVRSSADPPINRRGHEGQLRLALSRSADIGGLSQKGGEPSFPIRDHADGSAPIPAVRLRWIELVGPTLTARSLRLATSGGCDRKRTIRSRATGR